MVSQYEKFGNLILVQKQTTNDGEEGDSSFSLRFLLGQRDEVLEIYAKELAERICGSSDKALLLAICLKEKSPQTFLQILEGINQVCVW